MQHGVALQILLATPAWCGLQPALTCTLTQLQAVECLEEALCEAATSRSRGVAEEEAFPSFTYIIMLPVPLRSLAVLQATSHI